MVHESIKERQMVNVLRHGIVTHPRPIVPQPLVVVIKLGPNIILDKIPLNYSLLV
jgi:hypothetical protein